MKYYLKINNNKNELIILKNRNYNINKILDSINMGISYLKIGYCNISPTELSDIFKCIENSNVTIVDIRNNLINDTMLLSVIDNIQKSNITELHLRNNIISDIGLKYLLNILPNSKISKLDLRNNDISDINLIKQLLNNSLEFVDISSNDIGTLLGEYLLLTKIKVDKIDVRYNDIDIGLIDKLKIKYPYSLFTNRDKSNKC